MSYLLLDTDTANVVGLYDTEADALRDVAETVAAYGADSDAVLSLTLIRDDVPAGKGCIAAGAKLVARCASR